MYTKRLIEDIDGMAHDLLRHYQSLSRDELVDLIMELKHEGQDENDFIRDWINLCNGEVVDLNDNDLRKDYILEYGRDK